MRIHVRDGLNMSSLLKWPSFLLKGDVIFNGSNSSKQRAPWIGNVWVCVCVCVCVRE